MSTKCQSLYKCDTDRTIIPASEEKAGVLKRTKVNTTKNIPYRFERSGNVGIFTFSGELSSEYESDLAILLMKAVYGVERSVLNLKEVSVISKPCLKLLNKAYHASLRLKRPIIFTEVPQEYQAGLFDHGSRDRKDDTGYKETAPTERSKTKGSDKSLRTGIKNLAEAVILQSIEDLWHPSKHTESLEFFSGYASKIYYELAELDNAGRSRLLFLIKENMNDKFDTAHQA